MDRPPGLRLVLPLTTTLLIVAVGVGVSAVAASLLRRLGDEQAVERVRTAGIAAHGEITQTARDVDLSVRLLAERPTLQLYVENGERNSQRRFLSRFSETAELDGCAVLAGNEAISGGDAPWTQIAAAAAGTGEGWALVEGDPREPPLIVATRPMSLVAGVRVSCARRIDDVLTGEVSRQVGLPVRILSLREARASAGTRRSALLGAAAEESRIGTDRVDAVDAFVDVRPLQDPSGSVRAVVETRLDVASVDGSVRRLVRTVWLVLAIAVSLMGVLAFTFARRLTRPLAELARASARIGSGDLAEPVPHLTWGEAAQLAASMEDMRTGLLRLTSELRQRHGELAAILDGIVEGVWGVDRGRRIIWMNPQFAERLGIRAEEAIGRFCGDVLNPELPGGVRPCDTRCPIIDARFRGSARAVEHLVLADGTRRTVVITSASTTDAPGDDDRVHRQYQVMRDETDAEGGRRLRDALLANVSHEFRTPLSAQVASLEMLKERLEEVADPDALSLVRSTERGTLRLMRLVDNLLESLRIDAGTDSIRRRPVALEDVIDEAIEQTTPLTEQKNQTLEIRVPAKYPVVNGDGPRLVQALVNLLANANKFSPAGSRITIGGEVADDEIAVWVRDEGSGFPEDSDAVVFVPFSRAWSEEPAEPGIGLGLCIAQSIVHRHGGRLVARSARPGAQVTMYLPRRTGDEDPRG